MPYETEVRGLLESVRQQTMTRQELTGHRVQQIMQSDAYANPDHIDHEMASKVVADYYATEYPDQS